MKTLIIGIILGIVSWQFLTAAVYLLTKENKKKALLFSLFFMYILAWIVSWITELMEKFIVFIWRKHGYKK